MTIDTITPKLAALLGKASKRGYVLRGADVVVVDATSRDFRVEKALKSYAVNIRIETSKKHLQDALEKRMEYERAKKEMQLIREARNNCKRASRTKVVGKLLGTMQVTEFETAFEKYITTLYSFT